MDDLRFLSNLSTGRLGARIAGEAAGRGAVVVYVVGPGAALPAPPHRELAAGAEEETCRRVLEAPPGTVFVLRVGTAEEAAAALERLLRGLGPDAVVHAMAVADFTPARPRKGKIPSREGGLTLEFRPTPKILPRLREWAPGAVVVAAKFESGVGEEELLSRAGKLLGECDAVVATRREEWEPVHRAWFLAPPESPRRLEGKEVIAREVVGFLVSRLGEAKSPAGQGGAEHLEESDGSPGSPLRGLRIAVCVGAGIAACKAPHLVSLLVERGAEVEVLLTRRAHRFVSPLSLAALSGRPIHRRHLREEGSPLLHTRLGQETDAVVVAPATADLLARLRLGLADDVVTDFLLALGTRRPVILCPAMHTAMWENPVVREHVEALRQRGYLFLGPAEGRLAGGDWGVGRMEEPETIVEQLESLLSSPRDSRL